VFRIEPPFGHDVEIVEELNLPSDLAEAADEVSRLLAKAPEAIMVAERTYVLGRQESLLETQLGYRITPGGETLIGEGENHWRSSWLVVGWDEDSGDPLFVDLADRDLPVFTAMHGAGKWVAEPVAPQFRTLLVSDYR